MSYDAPPSYRSEEEPPSYRTYQSLSSLHENLDDNNVIDLDMIYNTPRRHPNRLTSNNLAIINETEDIPMEKKIKETRYSFTFRKHTK